MTTFSTSSTTRAGYAVVGALTGLAVWALIDVVPEAIANPRIVLALVAAGLGFFGVLLGLIGPVRLVPAAVAALAMAVPAAALLLWASFRHEDVENFLRGGYALAAFCYLLAIGLPFALAGLTRHQGWRHYGMLFDAAWSLVVRYGAAWLFVAIVWGVLALSQALLGLVGIDIIKTLIAMDPVPFLISGLAVGFGLAIVHEMRDYISPGMVIQLLRVLLPALLVVLAVFIVALPFRGLSNLFGQFSAAATLLGVTLAGITLVTTAIHRDDGLSVQGRGMQGAARALSVLLAVPALLAVWAVWLRVDQYGLTPNRAAALIAAFIIAAYAVAYAGAVLSGTAWRTRQRSVNRWMALATLAVAALWLTPILNAERLATVSQTARAEAGVPNRRLALWEMANEWGEAGARGLARLEARARQGDDADLLALIGTARQGGSKWQFDADAEGPEIASLDGIVPLRPEGRSLPDGAFAGLRAADRRMIQDACARPAPGGHPGCVMVIAAYAPERGGEQALGLFVNGTGGVQIAAYRLANDALIAEGYPQDLAAGGYPSLPPRTITDILEGRSAIAPVPRRVLDVGGALLFPQN